MTVFQETDAKVVESACTTLGIRYDKRVTMGDKIILKEYTGLSVNLVSRALTNIRKHCH